MRFSIGNISNISFDKAAFDSLVMAVAERQAEHKNGSDDVIHCKDQGMILLLSGSPGVGKTLTAESVAEEMQVSLYMMSAVDLGATSTGVESAPTRVLRMVTKWKAILLLDEADVFLEQRTTHNLERNKLVSSKLRPIVLTILSPLT